MADFIPNQDAQADVFFQTFANGINSSPSAYQLTSVDAASLLSAAAAFHAALMIASDPATRTKGTIIAKDDARFACEQLVRQYAALIKPNAGITDQNKADIGVPPVNTNREPVNVPASSPLLNVLGATPGSQTVRYADTNTPDSGARPFGAANLQLFVAIGTAPATDATFYGAFTRNPVPVAFAENDDGKVATYFARWADRKGQVGPWSVPVSLRIAA
jgi:hypothetical protein